MLRKLALLVFATAATATAQQPLKMALSETSSIRVDGTSNIHAWHTASSTITATIEVAAPADAGSKVESVTLTIPVTSLKSGKGGLDKNLYKALNAEKNPTIAYRMTSYQSELKDGAYVALVTGMLTVNGVEKEVKLDATMSGDGKVGLKATGTTKLLMTDFGVKPVTALMGTIRTGNEVTVKIDLTGVVAAAVAQLPEK